MSKAAAAPRLTGKLAKAFRFALAAHEGQTRKGTNVPYLSHPMAVASLVLERGGSQDQAAAARLHDTVEDCGVSYGLLARSFGAPVMRIVKDCTDSETTPKPPWMRRKLAYIKHVKACHPRSLLVSAADKLHNASSIVRDVRRGGKSVWKRFNAEPSQILWYYGALLRQFQRRRADAPEGFAILVDELGAAVRQLRELPC
ncbi:MAG: bifunctional (p)ppGpp synthetase/guanosine-3',5'-bis(diphosphate) 3'-pyrophosphohydrolase [Elusimicrobia bacterium]|nr:bifunctional (p)ppGpp synthetase/guanosine-3',5'-bis(diphosphate) 3'-pyrophosphohydrolase [Elusimicrobiota bacterium]